MLKTAMLQNIKNVFTVTFDQFNASLLNKNHTYKKIVLTPNVSTSVCILNVFIFLH